MWACMSRTIEMILPLTGALGVSEFSDLQECLPSALEYSPLALPNPSFHPTLSCFVYGKYDLCRPNYPGLLYVYACILTEGREKYIASLRHQI